MFCTSTTATATYTPPSSTYYPVCATNANLLSAGLDGGVLNLVTDVNGQTVSTPSAYDCCVACFQTTGCLGSNYGKEFTGSECELAVTSDGSCPANQGGTADSYYELGDATTALTFSNGPCGAYVYQLAAV